MTLFTGHTGPPWKFKSLPPDNIPGPKKERIVFQPSFFRGEVKLRGVTRLDDFFILIKEEFEGTRI